MSRLHVHIRVADLDRSIRYYSALFGAKPTRLKPGYAKWALDDPKVNFAISHALDGVTGVNHLGLQSEDREELAATDARLKAAGEATVDEAGAQCCYAVSDKHWSTDPDGVVWEAFHTMGEAEIFHETETVVQATVRQAPSGRCC